MEGRMSIASCNELWRARHPHIDSLLSDSDGLEGMARLGGDEYTVADWSAVNFFGAAGPNSRSGARRSSSSPPISFIPST